MLRNLLKENSGSAAVEMALVLPILITLLFGSFELGNYFLDNHIFTKAVRDGARFASRQSFTSFTCPSTIDSATTNSIRHVTRTGQVSGGNARLANWSDDTSVTVSLRCDTSGTYSGIYKFNSTGTPIVPVVKVSAEVSYLPLLSAAGFGTGNLKLIASAEIPVIGI
jgi:Flp pilus assembly protein TadG